MSNKNFIEGLLFGLAYAEITHNSHLPNCNMARIWFKNGDILLFAINRGISHFDGNLTAMLTDDERCNLFDIALNWINDNQLKIIKSMGYDFECGEIRVTKKQLIEIIDKLGIIDIEMTRSNTHKMFK